MRITYDPVGNAGYIEFRPKGSSAESIRVAKDANVDIAPNGEIYGVALLDANKQLFGNGGAIIYENQQTHQRQELRY